MLLEYHIKHLQQVEQLRQEKDEIETQLRTYHGPGESDGYYGHGGFNYHYTRYNLSKPSCVVRELKHGHVFHLIS
jgi:hypothetical protein